MASDLLRATPTLCLGGAVAAALLMGDAPGHGRTPPGALALGVALSGGAADIVATLLKECLFRPLYTHLGADTLPILGRGPRPEGATRCGGWPYGPSGRSAAPTRTFGLPSGHAACMCGMLGFLLYQAKSGASGLGYMGLSVAGTLTLAVCISRVVLGCHTISQVAWGSSLGLALGWAAGGTI